MQSNTVIRDSFYDSVYPHLNFLDTVSLSADGDATVNLITKTINQHTNSDYIKQVVNILRYEPAPDNIEFAKRLFYICCYLIKYRKDPEGHEIIFTPAMLMKVKQGDCKKFTTFICTVLKAAGINSASKVCSYEPGADWQHIYAIMFTDNQKGYITLDPVNHKKYDSEVRYYKARVNFFNFTYSKTLMNKLSVMGNLPENFANNFNLQGIGDACGAILSDLGGVEDTGLYQSLINPTTMAGIADDYINGVDNDPETIGRRKSAPQKAAAKAKRKEKIKTFKKKAFTKLKQNGFAPARIAFLKLIAAGRLVSKTPLKLNLAEGLAKLWVKDNGAALSKIWVKFGGKPMALKKAIAKAAKTKISGIGANEYSIEGIGVVTVATIAAAVTAASPIIVQIIKLLREQKVINSETSEMLQEGVEVVEEKVIDDTKAATGKEPEPTQVLTKATESVNQETMQNVIKQDEGGNPEAERIIKRTSTPVEESVKRQEQEEPESVNAADPSNAIPKGISLKDLKTPGKYFYPGMISLCYGITGVNKFHITAQIIGVGCMIIAVVGDYVQQLKNKSNVKI